MARLRWHADKNVPEALCWLGSYYRDGLGSLVKSPKKARRLYERAAELGDVTAMANLGRLFETGEGGKLDKKKALQLFRRAADRGHAHGQHNFARHLQKAGDVDDAARFCSLAAAQGLTVAEYGLGASYEGGFGVPKDLDEAKRLYALAAAKGHKRAKAALAELAELGRTP